MQQQNKTQNYCQENKKCDQSKRWDTMYFKSYYKYLLIIEGTFKGRKILLKGLMTLKYFQIYLKCHVTKTRNAALLSLKMSDECCSSDTLHSQISFYLIFANMIQNVKLEGKDRVGQNCSSTTLTTNYTTHWFHCPPCATP